MTQESLSTRLSPENSENSATNVRQEIAEPR